MIRSAWRNGMAIVLGSVAGAMAYYFLMSLASLTSWTKTWLVLSVMLGFSYLCASTVTLVSLGIQKRKRIRWLRGDRIGVAAGLLAGCTWYWTGLYLIGEDENLTSTILIPLMAYPVSGLTCLATLALTKSSLSR